MSDEELLIKKDDEKRPYPVYHQPTYQPRPVAGAEFRYSEKVSGKPPKRALPPNRTSSIKRKRFWPSSSASPSRRPHISVPYDFRHISTASPHIPQEPTPSPKLRPAKQLRHRSFRPLELSIYMSDNHVSPILPHFETPPGSRAGTAPSEDRLEEDRPLVHQKSVSSSMSFHIPRRQGLESSPSIIQEDRISRRQGLESSPSTSQEDRIPRRQPLESSPSTSQDTPRRQALESSPSIEELPPMIPPRAKSRPRAYTSGEVDSMKKRVASAMLEVERLQKQIDDVIERHSQYTLSRPSTSHSAAHTMPGMQSMNVSLGASLTEIDLEPMPSIPALPPAAPSFAERLNSDITRPHTAPINPILESARRAKMRPTPPPIPRTPPLRIKHEERQPPPPLPLVLRPPLRKKKSFSRVSNWLFPGPEHKREMSFDSVTNQPRPIKGNEGFYQCFSQGETRRRSGDSIDTISTWETSDDHTLPTTGSPGSTPATRQEEPFISLARNTNFGKPDFRPRRTSVGVAF